MDWIKKSTMALVGVMTILLVLVGQACAAATDAVRVKDLGRMQGWRDNAIVGYGIVTGLAGTGDSATNKTTRQALANVFSQFNLTIAPEQVQSRNVAVVLVTAALPTFAHEGDAIDVTVTSAGDARSLLGGTLLMTPLKAANGRIYALAQGPLSVGGYRYDANGNVVQKNHPTVGSVPGGAIVEIGVGAKIMNARHEIVFLLAEPDYTTASRIATAINHKLGEGTAWARDAAGVTIQVPEHKREQLTNYITGIESVMVEPDIRAKVVINERTGTVVSGGDVRISRVAVSHGDLKVSISTENAASQPFFIGTAGPGVRTEIVSNTKVEVDERNGPGFVSAGNNTVADLVQSLVRVKTNTRDIISILRAIKAAGALHAELVVQ